MPRRRRTHPRGIVVAIPGPDDEDEEDDDGPGRVSTIRVDQVTTRTIFNNQPVEESFAEGTALRAEGTALRAVALEAEHRSQAGWSLV